MNREKIKFYRTNDKYGEFSNFAAYPIELKGQIWATTEHYYQAQKFAGTPYESEIMKSSTPKEAAKMGRDRKESLRPDWEIVKDSIMYDAVKAKFTQHPELRELLLSTRGMEIIEHTETDNYWGDGLEGKGKNMLGKILMKVRGELCR